MGGGSDTEQEHLLIVLPFEKPAKGIESIKKKFPHMKVTYKNTDLVFYSWDDVVRHIPKGIFKLHLWHSLVL